MNAQDTEPISYINALLGAKYPEELRHPQTLSFVETMARFHLEKTNRKDVQGNVRRIIAADTVYELRCGLDFVMSVYAGENKLHSWAANECFFTTLVPAYAIIWQDVYNKVVTSPIYPLLKKYARAVQIAHRRIYNLNHIAP